MTASNFVYLRACSTKIHGSKIRSPGRNLFSNPGFPGSGPSTFLKSRFPSHSYRDHPADTANCLWATQVAESSGDCGGLEGVGSRWHLFPCGLRTQCCWILGLFLTYKCRQLIHTLIYTGQIKEPRWGSQLATSCLLGRLSCKGLCTDLAWLLTEH